MRPLFVDACRLGLGALLLIECCNVSAAQEIPQDGLGKTRSVRILDSGAAGAKPQPSTGEAARLDPAPPPLPEPDRQETALPIEPKQATAPAETSVPGSAPPGVEETPGFVVVPKLPAVSMKKVENPAELTIDIVSGQSLTIGSRVAFRISSKKSGYLILVDIDADGKLTQIYPNTGLLARNFKPGGNFIKSGAPLTIPSTTNAYGATEYVVGPPIGQALVVAILCERPVQILDLPNVPPGNGQADAVAYLAKQVSELRIPEQSSGQLREAKWSFDSKSYVISN